MLANKAEIKTMLGSDILSAPKSICYESKLRKYYILEESGRILAWNGEGFGTDDVVEIVLNDGVVKHKMVEITASLLDKFVSTHREQAIKAKSTRHNFDKCLSFLRAVLNWYRQNYDALFVIPVLPRHKQAGIIRDGAKKNKKLRPEELIAFFQELPPFWRDFAETQFYMGARVSEVAGFQVKSVDLKELEICIQYVSVWSYKTKYHGYLKEIPKNGEISYASMNKKLEEIMRRRLPLAVGGFVFHDEGKPLSYRQIQYQYNLALKKAGLSSQYSSTHIMRHSMGTITRKVTGSVDMAQAVTRPNSKILEQKSLNLSR